MREKLGSQLEPARVVHGEQANRGSAARRESLQISPACAEVLLPLVSPGVKERHDLTGEGIDSRQVGSLVQVTAVAGQSQVIEVVRAAVLPGDDVLDVVGQLAVLLDEPAVFTTIRCPTANPIPRGGVHA
ncbi:hypothetical protein BH23GEM7_BH23GEM7_30910 [soil metagenome]